uniref:Uncharacterized protein n=1 Tax=Oryza brachyantha TaxID=4533 RepID=J3MZ93_ORYBR
MGFYKVLLKMGKTVEILKSAGIKLSTILQNLRFGIDIQKEKQNKSNQISNE